MTKKNSGGSKIPFPLPPPRHNFSNGPSLIKAVYWVAFALARKTYRIGLLFAHKNSDFGAIYVTEAKLRRADFYSGESYIR